ncbi:MAG: AAA domain-containing protein [Planctomycetota bacterium]|nr:AAA domain-containing protein [Planctomycetota bacterium]
MSRIRRDEAVDEFKWLRAVCDITRRSPDDQLFVGIGTLFGYADTEMRERQFAAPLAYAVCDIDDSEEEMNVEIRPDTLQLNFDFLSELLGRYNEEFDDIDIDRDDAQRAIQKAVDLLPELSERCGKEFDKISEDIWRTLNGEFEEFGDNISLLSQFKSTDEIPATLLETNPETAEPCFYVYLHTLFVAKVPDSLSTYTSLNQLKRSLSGSASQHLALNKLLSSLRDPEKIIYPERDQKIERDVEEAIQDFIPYSLSDSQVEAVKNAFSMDFSYIQGPPGTGKSFTIFNILLCALIMKKTVLVVSQKKPALDVICESMSKVTELTDSGPAILHYSYGKSRRKLKVIVDRLIKFAESSLRSWEPNTLERQISEIKKSIGELNAEIDKYTDKKKKFLDEAKHHRDAQEKFSDLKKRFLDEEEIEISREFHIEHRLKPDRLSRFSRNFAENTADSDESSLLDLAYATKLSTLAKEMSVGLHNCCNPPVFAATFDSFAEIYETSYTADECSRKLERTPYSQITHKLDELIQERHKACEKFFELLPKYAFLNAFSSDPYQMKDQMVRLKGMLHNVRADLVESKQRKLDFSILLELLPLWTGEVRHLSRLLPMQECLFDIVIVDEASQVNIPEVFPALYRGKNIVVVGDHKQLGLSSTGIGFKFTKKYDQLMWEKHISSKSDAAISYSDGVKRKLAVSQASILDFMMSESQNAEIQEVVLNEHYRSLPALAAFTNISFYDKTLAIMTETPEKVERAVFKPVRVRGRRATDTGKKINYQEASKVVSIVQGILKDKQKYRANQQVTTIPEHVAATQCTVGIISIIRDHANYIKEKLHSLEGKNGYDSLELVCGTPEELQGHEKEVIIITACLDNDSKGFGHFNKPDRMNVAFSRAKSFVFFVYSNIPPDFTRVRQYLSHFTPSLDEQSICGGEYSMPASALNPVTWEFRQELMESDFERKVYRFIKEKIIADNPQFVVYNQVETCGQKRLDFVVFNKNNKKFVAIEVDGARHFDNDMEYSQQHLDRMYILKRAGWKIINTPYHRWYNNGWLCDEDDPANAEEQRRLERLIHNALRDDNEKSTDAFEPENADSKQSQTRYSG